MLATVVGGLALIASLAGLASTSVLALHGKRPNGLAPVTRLPEVDAVDLAGERLAYWQRFALNGLLVPLLDVDEPDHWSEPGPAQPCLETSRVTIDDRPLPAGRPLPTGPFTLRWTLADCRPFGPESLAMWGTVEARLTQASGRVSGRLQPLELVLVDADGLPRRAAAPFDASLALLPLLRN